ncbi:cell wall assembly protein [Mesorhizobium plurifarium]|uniref:SMI1/KNR4 family protein n=1 Tax=Sinorhizobium arboris TaxID=76745 RepID=UPI0004075577|nr:SMI1/KNR4 family protein [Sinorhizobium arboris]PST26364.1 cell wall assembly protein [Mesorhizobium plurifarium]
MSIPLDPVRSLKRIEAWVARYYPDRLPFVRPGVNSCTIQRFETKFGKALPSDLRLLYTAHDGQPEGAPTLYLNQRWLPLDLAAVAWEDLCLRYGTGDEFHLVALADDRPLRQATTWSADWLPLFSSPRGDHYCIDLRTKRADRYGQVIWFLYDRTERAVVAQSIGDLFRRVADGLDAGKWRLDDGYDGLSD